MSNEDIQNINENCGSQIQFFTISQDKKIKRSSSSLHQWKKQDEFDFLLIDMIKHKKCQCQIDINQLYPQSLGRKIKNSKAQKILLNLNKLRIFSSQQIQLIQKRESLEKISFFQENLTSLLKRHYNIFKHYPRVNSFCRNNQCAFARQQSDGRLSFGIDDDGQDWKKIEESITWSKRHKSQQSQPQINQEKSNLGNCNFQLLFDLHWIFTQINKIHEYQNQCLYTRTKQEMANLDDARQISRKYYGCKQWPLALYPTKYQDPQSVQLKYLAGLDFALYFGGYTLLLKLVIQKVSECLDRVRQWKTNRLTHKALDLMNKKYKKTSKSISESSYIDEESQEIERPKREPKTIKKKGNVKKRNVAQNKQTNQNQPKFLKRFKKCKSSIYSINLQILAMQKEQGKTDNNIFILQSRVAKRRISTLSNLSGLQKTEQILRAIKIEQEQEEEYKEYKESMIQLKGGGNLKFDNLMRVESNLIIPNTMAEIEEDQQEELGKFDTFLKVGKLQQSLVQDLQNPFSFIDNSNQEVSKYIFSHDILQDIFQSTQNCYMNLQHQREISYTNPLELNKRSSFFQNSEA